MHIRVLGPCGQGKEAHILLGSQGEGSETNIFEIARQNLVLGVMELRKHSLHCFRIMGLREKKVGVTRPREVYPITGLSETGVALRWESNTKLHYKHRLWGGGKGFLSCAQQSKNVLSFNFQNYCKKVLSRDTTK